MSSNYSFEILVMHQENIDQFSHHQIVWQRFSQNKSKLYHTIKLTVSLFCQPHSLLVNKYKIACYEHL